jgi:hypothetical protein
LIDNYSQARGRMTKKEARLVKTGRWKNSIGNFKTMWTGDFSNVSQWKSHEHIL